MKLTLVLLCAVIAVSLTEAHRRSRCNRCPSRSSSSSSSSDSSDSDSREHHHHCRRRLNLRPQKSYESRPPRYYRFRKPNNGRWFFDRHHHHHHHIRPVVIAPLPVPVFSAPAQPSYSSGYGSPVAAAPPASGYQTYTRVANDAPVGPVAPAMDSMNSRPAPPAVQNSPVEIVQPIAQPPAMPEPEVVVSQQIEEIPERNLFPEQTDSQKERTIMREEAQQKEFERDH